MIDYRKEKNVYMNVKREYPHISLMKGKSNQLYWYQKILNARHIFWGVKGVRASFLSRKFISIMQRGDMFVEEDLSLTGQMKYGLPVCVPDVIKKIVGENIIIVLSENYVRVKERLVSCGYVENLDFVEGQQLLCKGENSFIDSTILDKKNQGMIVYGMGDHLADMLSWHPMLSDYIVRVIDKDKKKIGALVPNLNGVKVEEPTVLKQLPSGTEIVVAAIRYLSEIKMEINSLHPGLIIRSIDEVWNKYVSWNVDKEVTYRMEDTELGRLDAFEGIKNEVISLRKKVSFLLNETKTYHELFTKYVLDKAAGITTKAKLILIKNYTI